MTKFYFTFSGENSALTQITDKVKISNSEKIILTDNLKFDQSMLDDCLKNNKVFEVESFNAYSGLISLQRLVSLIPLARSLNEDTFNYFFDQLYAKSKQANEALYKEEQNNASKGYRRKKAKSSAPFISEWQRIFNAWTENKIAHPLIVAIVQQEHVEYGIADQLIEETNKMIDAKFKKTHRV